MQYKMEAVVQYKISICICTISAYIYVQYMYMSCCWERKNFHVKFRYTLYMHYTAKFDIYFVYSTAQHILHCLLVFTVLCSGKIWEKEKLKTAVLHLQ